MKIYRTEGRTIKRRGQPETATNSPKLPTHPDKAGPPSFEGPLLQCKQMAHVWRISLLEEGFWAAQLTLHCFSAPPL